MTFNPSDHVIIMERKSKKKDSQGRETWEVTKTEYLPVQWRLYWFRLENQKGKIDSRAFTIDLEKGAAIFETLVEREDGGSARMHGSETQGDWRDYIEKAQTKSLGRALAAVGYGSQFTDDEFAEGERIVDSPIARSHATHDDAPQTHQNGHQGASSGATDKSQGQSDNLQALIGRAKQRAWTLKLATDKPTWEALLHKATGVEGIQEKDVTLALVAKLNGYIADVERQRAQLQAS